MKIGIVIPTLNRNLMLREALCSAITQTRPADEIFISDNCSDTSNETLLEEFLGHPIKYCRHARRLSIEDHWWWALTQPQTDYVCLLEDDNLYRPDHLASLEEAAAMFPEATLLGTSAMVFETNPGCHPRVNFAPVWPVDLQAAKACAISRTDALTGFLFGTPLAASCVMIKRKAFLEPPFEKCGYSMPVDRWLWAQFAAFGHTVFQPRPTMLYRLHASNMTKSVHRRTHIEETVAVTQRILQLMEHQGLDPDRAVREFSAKLDGYARDQQGKYLLRLRRWDWILRFLSGTYGKTSFFRTWSDCVRLLKAILYERLDRVRF